MRYKIKHDETFTICNSHIQVNNMQHPNMYNTRFFFKKLFNSIYISKKFFMIYLFYFMLVMLKVFNNKWFLFDFSLSKLGFVLFFT